ncbi:MAG: hypothetical protein RLZZ546_2950 [Bacteroidota bacterium]|jgi:hypothetical protein
MYFFDKLYQTIMLLDCYVILSVTFYFQCQHVSEIESIMTNLHE